MLRDLLAENSALVAEFGRVSVIRLDKSVDVVRVGVFVLLPSLQYKPYWRHVPGVEEFDDHLFALGVFQCNKGF